MVNLVFAAEKEIEEQEEFGTLDGINNSDSLMMKLAM